MRVKIVIFLLVIGVLGCNMQVTTDLYPQTGRGPEYQYYPTTQSSLDSALQELYISTVKKLLRDKNTQVVLLSKDCEQPECSNLMNSVLGKAKTNLAALVYPIGRINDSTKVGIYTQWIKLCTRKSLPAGSSDCGVNIQSQTLIFFKFQRGKWIVDRSDTIAIEGIRAIH